MSEKTDHPVDLERVYNLEKDYNCLSQEDAEEFVCSAEQHKLSEKSARP